MVKEKKIEANLKNYEKLNLQVPDSKKIKNVNFLSY